MAIMHTKTKIVSRGKGQSAVAAAAYRSGEKLVDERTGEVKNYSRKVQPQTFILAPKHAPEWVHDRQQLWNEVEKIEKNKNAQLAREFLVALPIELNEKEQNGMLKKYVQEQFVDKGMVADVAIHRDDQDNPHAHILLTVRPFNERGEWGNKKRKEYLYDEQGNKILDDKGKPKYKTHFVTDWDKKENPTKWREAWANEINHELEKKGIDQRVSHLSYEKQGIDKVPTVHLGHVAAAMEKKGKPTEKGDLNRDIKAYNELNELIVKYEKFRGDLEQKYTKEVQGEKFYSSFTPEENEVWEKAKQYFKKPTIVLSDIEKRIEQIQDWKNKKAKKESFLSWKSETIEKARPLLLELQKQQAIVRNNERELENINFKNPFKIIENKRKEEGLRSATNYAKEKIRDLESKLQYHKDKLKFTTYEEFQKVANDFKNEFQETTESLRKQNIRIRNELEVLQKSSEAFKSNYIRVVGEKYTDSPEMAYISYETAKNLNEVQRVFGRPLKTEEIREKHQISERTISAAEKLKDNKDPDVLKYLEDMQPQIEQMKQSFNLLDSIIVGMQQAQQQHQQRENKKERDPLKRKMDKYRSKGLER